MTIIERDIVSVKEDLHLVKDDIQDIKQNIIPSVKETLATMNAKLQLANAMGWLVALLLGFILYKLWDISAIVYALSKR